MKDHKINTGRREFIKNTGVVTGGILLSSVMASNAGCQGVNKKVNYGLIGCRNMGFSNFKAFTTDKLTECVAICDIDTKILASTANDIEKQTGKKPVQYQDFRRLLENKDIDAVIIATPDHWHIVMMIMALEAGKHVYVEKPMGHSIEECLVMEKIAKKYPNLAIQVGMWQRSSKHWFDACDVVKSGKLGDVNLVKAWIYKGMDFPVERKEDSPKPDHVDYDMWLGPAPMRPFNENRFHYKFRWYWDYAGGAMTDWGVHLLDFAMLGMNAGYPDSIAPGGGIYLHQPGTIEVPDIQQAIYAYPKHTMMWECGLIPGMGPYGMDHGVAFIGTRGTLVLSRKGWRVVPEKKNEDNTDWIKTIEMQPAVGGLNDHVVNFLEAIRSGDKLNAPVEVGSKVAIVSEMGNIAFRVGQKINWDQKTMKFREEEANKLTSLQYREPWNLPKV